MRLSSLFEKIEELQQEVQQIVPHASEEERKQISKKLFNIYSSINQHSLERQVEKAWVEILARIWVVARQKVRIKQQYRFWEFFEHRMRRAQKEPNVAAVIDRLCHSLSLQAPKLPIDYLNFLRANEPLALQIFRKDVGPNILTNYAAERAKSLKKGVAELTEFTEQGVGDEEWGEVEKELGLGGDKSE